MSHLIEWVMNYLVEDRQLYACEDHLIEMSNTKVADANALDFPGLLGIANSTPALFPDLGSTDGGVQEIQINVFEPHCFERRIDGLHSGVVRDVVLELGRPENL